MSGKRRDRRNRILRSGESQRRDGRYAYKYIDTTGEPQFVYSWKLEKTDKTPLGKRDDLSLREKEKLILKDIDDEIVPRGGEMTVEQLVRTENRGCGTTQKQIITLSSILSRKKNLVKRELTRLNCLTRSAG